MVITVARAVTAATLAGVLALSPTTSTAQTGGSTDGADPQVRVMARNLYLGADIGVALDLLPDMPAAAQFMWDQVADTDFGTRVEELAAEAVRYRPDVIGLQEATTWSCRTGLLGSDTTVVDFTEQFLEAVRDEGVSYVVAERDGQRASNPGYAIPAIPGLTTVTDPATFGPLFGQDSADCGFTIADALLVRSDLAESVLAVGTSEFSDRYPVVPVVWTIDRGFAWADLAIGGTTVRVVTTHLESQFAGSGEPTSALQARQLVDGLSSTTVPLVVLGDFNADPRDPRGPEDPNPAGQPAANETCPAQPEDPTLDTANVTCNAFWTMLDAGYDHAGPDPLDPRYHTFGSAADLAGPDPDRLDDALAAGNAAGFTERLDHIFVGNGAEAIDALIIGNQWPNAEDLWDCSSASQVANTQTTSAILADAGVAEAITGRGVCLPTDHAGVVATIDVSAGPVGEVAVQAPPENSTLRISLLGWIGIILGAVALLFVLAVVGVALLVRRGWRRRRERATVAAVTGEG